MEDQKTEIEAYSKTAAGIAELRSRLAGVVYTDITTAKGLAVAKADRAELRGLRTDLEEMRKEIKAPVLERAKLIDTEAKRLTAAITELEDPIDDQIKKEEERREAEKERKAAEDRARVLAIHQKIDAIRRMPQDAVGLSSAFIAQLRYKVAALRFVEGWDVQFEEFGQEAKAVRDTTIIQLADLQDKAFKQEEEARQLAAERAELQALKEAEAKRKAQEEARAKAEKAEFIRQEALRAAVEAQTRAAEQKKLDEERAALAAEKAALDKQRAALEAERQEREQREAAQRIAEAAERRRAEAEAKLAEQERDAGVQLTISGLRQPFDQPEIPLPSHVQIEIIEHLAEQYNADPMMVLDWISEMNLIDLRDYFSKVTA
jgi:hypothetical protein